MNADELRRHQRLFAIPEILEEVDEAHRNDPEGFCCIDCHRTFPCETVRLAREVRILSAIIRDAGGR